ncbi:hypothetical protein IGI04_002254 [Brassica rapa subsp. trilocularis]|uniref:Uncharacterized protein n=1 Tax=Brassica rapa subsp. trilocularis TaxID=1813537 RepID=A0ABQ7NUZ9_BRACM|nr:hypothetical protein IGI04_002254 [Brassica rapa subsp. trilocularis]
MAQQRETLRPTRLRRRADKHCGSDVPLASKQHREPTVGSPGSTGAHGLHTITTAKRLRQKSYPSPFVAITERKTSREPSPLTLVELQSSSDIVTTNPNQPKTTTLKGKKQTKP